MKRTAILYAFCIFASVAEAEIITYTGNPFQIVGANPGPGNVVATPATWSFVAEQNLEGNSNPKSIDSRESGPISNAILALNDRVIGLELASADFSLNIPFTSEEHQNGNAQDRRNFELIPTAQRGISGNEHCPVYLCKTNDSRI